jgi:glycosyltransferase involved in cell wall biosynthesis
MKLIYLFNGRLPTEKAHGLQIAKMCEAFAEAGNQVTLLSSYRLNPIKKDIFSFYGLKKNFKYHQVVGLDLSWLAEKIFYHIQTLSSALLLVLYAQRYRGEGVIFYARDYWTLFFLCVFGAHPVAEIHDYRFSKPKSFLWFVFNKSRKVIVNSKGTKASLLEHYKFPESKILVAPNGVDLESFRLSETQEQARNELGLPTGIVIGYTGRLETAGMDKGVGLLIEAMSLMEHNSSILCIVGGPDSHVKYFKEKTQKLGLAGRVIFTGQVAHALIPKYLRAIDVVVIPLASGQHALTTSPLKLFEYLAAGKAIVASDLPGLRDVVGSDDVLFFKPGDAHDLVAQLDKVISNPSLASELAQNSLKRAEQYSWLVRAQAIKKFITYDAN